jgi:hypothetical protein
MILYLLCIPAKPKILLYLKNLGTLHELPPIHSMKTFTENLVAKIKHLHKRLISYTKLNKRTYSNKVAEDKQYATEYKTITVIGKMYSYKHALQFILNFMLEQTCPNCSGLINKEETINLHNFSDKFLQ